MREHLMLAVAHIKTNARNARTHSKKQIQQIADSIRAVGFAAPVIVDEDFTLLAGHGRLEAAKSLAMTEIPAVVLRGLSEAKKRLLLLADNRLAQSAGWDREQLAIELSELPELLAAEDLDIALSGFAPAEIDILLEDFEADSSDPADTLPEDVIKGPIVSMAGDIWILGKHRLMCGDARDLQQVQTLMAGGRADMGLTDAPYNVRVRDIVGRGRIRHAEFRMASGEMSSDAFRQFLAQTLGNAVRCSRDGALHYNFMDWKHIDDLLAIGRPLYGAFLNLICWAKTNAGQGSHYRSQHELIGLFRVGEEPHLNTIELGRFGRDRSNVWRYAGVNTFRRGRAVELGAHPTPKPVALLADAIKDATRRNDLVLDVFCGSGSTILAAERVGRQARGLEIEPRYVDVAVRRWQAFTGRDAVHAVTGEAFASVEQERRSDNGRGRTMPTESARAEVRS